MFRAELYNIVPHEMYLVLPDGFKLLFSNVLHTFIYLFIYLKNYEQLQIYILCY